MKKIVILLAAFMLATSLGYSQDYKRDGKEFSAVSAPNEKGLTDVKTEYTWRDSKGEVHPIWITKSGACYILRVSKKTGKAYKSYLPKAVAEEIKKEMKK